MKSAIFPIADFEQSAKLPSGKSIVITELQLDELLMSEKGARTFMLLSLNAPTLKFHLVQFHQDHIHPHSGFETSKLKPLGFENEKIDQWKAKGDCLPNLQLLEGKENHSKSKTPFAQWIAQEYPDEIFRNAFRKSQFIPPEISLDLKDFNAFFEARRKIIERAFYVAVGRRIIKVTLNSSIVLSMFHVKNVISSFPKKCHFARSWIRSAKSIINSRLASFALHSAGICSAP